MRKNVSFLKFWRLKLILSLAGICILLAKPVHAQDDSTPEAEAGEAEPIEAVIEADASTPVAGQKSDGLNTPVEETSAQADTQQPLLPQLPDALPVPQTADADAYVSPTDPVTEYLNALDFAESNGSAYSIELADLYLGLGKALLNNLEFDEAKEAFQQGMQVVRVNFGLDSPEQSSYLFSIADIEMATGNPKDAVKVLDALYVINAKHYGAQSPAMLPVLNRMLNWYMKNKPLDAPESRFADMQRAEGLASQMGSIMEKEYGLEHPETAAMYRRVGQISWMTLDYVLGQGISVEPGFIVSVGSPPQNPNAEGISVKGLIAEGRVAFAKVAESVNASEERSGIEKAEAIAQLGDWNLSFGRRQTAAESYRQAHELLLETSQSLEFADAYFANPTPVRFMHTELTPVTMDTVSGGSTLDVSMTVTEGGRPLAVDIVDPPAEFAADHVRKMKRMVANMRFRPRLEKGEPVKTREFVWKLPLSNPEWLP